MTSDQFWDRVYYDTSGAGCWLWYGTTNTNGYGLMFHEGRRIGTHRFAWMECYGPIPEGAYILHRCDVPLCVRPDHLFCGGPLENMLDRERKGRARHDLCRGELHGMSKLSESQVRAILARKGESQRAIAKDYGIDPSTVSGIHCGRKWRHLHNGG